jgi:hypothetical protein
MTQTVEVYDQGVLVARVTDHSGDAAVASDSPRDWHWRNGGTPLRINHPGGCTGTFPSGTLFQLLGGQVVVGDAIKMIPENHPLESAHFSQIALRARSIPSITLDGESSGQGTVAVRDEAPARGGTLRPWRRRTRSIQRRRSVRLPAPDGAARGSTSRR